MTRRNTALNEAREKATVQPVKPLNDSDAEELILAIMTVFKPVEDPEREANNVVHYVSDQLPDMDSARDHAERYRTLLSRLDRVKVEQHNTLIRFIISDPPPLI